jgi:hypothetical protein
MKTKGIAMFQYHREDDTPSPAYENKLGFFKTNQGHPLDETLVEKVPEGFTIDQLGCF